jgi:trans-2,3-dihydro-3-hydroxyanthranilate isomerase
MASFRFYLVDVFAPKKYAGNQLAVVLAEKGLSTEKMQLIALEMNYSETTFILSSLPEQNGFPVRIFTPTTEIPFAGHPTLGTAFIIKKIFHYEKAPIMLNLQVGPIPVAPEINENGEEIYWMTQLPPQFGRNYSPEKIAPALNLSPTDIDPNYPIQEVSTGLPFLVVPLCSLSALRQAKLEKNLFYQVVNKGLARAPLIFCPESYTGHHHLSVRVFADYYGVPEDPATGSANGCLAGYLAHYQYFGSSDLNIRVEQGFEVKRPSLLYLRASPDEKGTIKVEVGGQVILVARGELI